MPARFKIDVRAVGVIAIATLTMTSNVRAGEAEHVINGIDDISRAVGTCWISPPLGTRTEIDFLMRVSFRRNGELLGPPFLIFQTAGVSEDERRRYRTAAGDALKRCTPLRLSEQFASGMAGHPITLRITARGKGEPVP